MVFTLDVRIKGLKEFGTLTRNFPRATIRLNKDIRKKLANTLIEEMRKEVARPKKYASSIATGHLYKDIYSRDFSKGPHAGETRVYFGKPRSDYAIFVDRGFANKKMPPVGGAYGIYRWVQAKGLEMRPRYRKYGKNSRTPGKIYGKPHIPTQEQTAYAIARWMKGRSHKGEQIVRKAFSKTKTKMDRIIDEEVDKVMKVYGF